MPKEIIAKDRHELLREKLKSIVELLQPLSTEERVRVLRTIVVFFDIEQALQ